MPGGRRALAVGIACAMLAAIALYFTFFSASPEDRVRKTLSEFAAIVSVKDGDTLISRTARLRSRLKDVVDDDVRVDVDELRIDVRGRRDLEDAAIKTGLMFQSADCVFAKLAIKLDAPETLATVDGVALVTALRGGERKVDERAVHFLLRKDGAWRITTIDVAPPKNE
jgi:hypothetical protein